MTLIASLSAAPGLRRGVDSLGLEARKASLNNLDGQARARAQPREPQSLRAELSGHLNRELRNAEDTAPDGGVARLFNEQVVLDHQILELFDRVGRWPTFRYAFVLPIIKSATGPAIFLVSRKLNCLGIRTLRGFNGGDPQHSAEKRSNGAMELAAFPRCCLLGGGVLDSRIRRSPQALFR